MKIKNAQQLELLIQTKKRKIIPRSNNQIKYFKLLNNKRIIFAVGPAGTGKTFLAVAKAVAALQKGLVKKIILSRPAVEAGEKLGFLPGDLKEKIDPYLRPIYDCLDENLPKVINVATRTAIGTAKALIQPRLRNKYSKIVPISRPLPINRSIALNRN